jgi:hypothetical protein
MTKVLESFPYTSNGMIGVPYYDGMVVGSNIETGTIFMPVPNGETASLEANANRGAVREYLGDTQCIDTNTTGHSVLVGDF